MKDEIFYTLDTSFYRNSSRESFQKRCSELKPNFKNNLIYHINLNGNINEKNETEYFKLSSISFVYNDPFLILFIQENIDLNLIFKYSLSQSDIDFIFKTLFLNEDSNIKKSKELRY